MLRFLALVLLSTLLQGVALTCFAAEWKAGTGREVITPPHSMPMAGYASRGASHATGKLQDLWAKSLMLEDAAGNRCVLVTLDLCGIDAILADRVCLQLKQSFGLQRNQIMLATSHTHSGPVVAGNLRPMHYMMFSEADRSLVDEYASLLVDKIRSTVEQAIRDLQLSELSYGEGNESFAVNRRTNIEKDVPELRAAGKLAGPSDHSVPVLLVKRAGQPIAVMFGYACHCTTLSGMDWSGDYAGFAQAEIEKDLPGCTAMFWAGCGADQNPLPRRTVELATEYGHRLATAVRKAMSSDLKSIEPQLQTEFKLIPVPFGPMPTRAQIEQDRKSDNQYVSARAQSLLQTLDAGAELPSTYDYPVAVWHLGQSLDWVALGGEVVVDYAIAIKTLPAAKRTTWVTAYANDVMAYIPSRRVLMEGGYEGGGAMVYYGLPTVWAPEIEPMILDEVSRQLAKP
ncbi:MAG: neutral/alkaline non-lysosomal ceramidase N-terminal domain-containing protein [Pirellulaceae bacterium]|nr:neutral/alkaline non-lysosomal ceramidase N-terminal domain-containing protein [Pirellulaceae bacterium]